MSQSLGHSGQPSDAGVGNVILMAGCKRSKVFLATTTAESFCLGWMLPLSRHFNQK